MLKVDRVESKKDWEEFIDFQWEINSADPKWVPPLRIAVKDQLDVTKNPYFRHATMRLFLLRRGGKVVGRIGGFIDDNHNKFHDEKTVFFGFFECVNEPEAAKMLFDAVAQWGKSQGMTTMRGPVNLSTNYECGLLIEGFEDTPSVMMPHNPKYYASLFEECGMTKAKDLYAYLVSSSKSEFDPKLFAKAEKLKQAAGVVFRDVRMNDFSNEVERILEIYNDAWEKNWGFVPMDPDEFRHMANDMKMLVDPRFLIIAEVQGKPAGFMLALPDVNQVFKKIPDGRLSPINIVKMLWNLKGPGRKKTINRVRILTLGVKKAFREYGLGPVFYTEALKRAPQCGYPDGEASWILEDNGPMNMALKYMGAQRTKVYRLYDRSL